MSIASVGTVYNDVLTRQEGVEVDSHSQMLSASLHFNSHMQLSLHQLTPLQNVPPGDLH